MDIQFVIHHVNLTNLPFPILNYCDLIVFKKHHFKINSVGKIKAMFFDLFVLGSKISSWLQKLLMQTEKFALI